MALVVMKIDHTYVAREDKKAAWEEIIVEEILAALAHLAFESQPA